jgi:threonylcarbamoyladenosine tRNA methylthiotransferase MtaB
MTVAFHTLGCKLNQSETEALAGAYERAGFVIARPGEQAELVIVNSCTVTGRSDAKARHAVRQAASSFPDALIVLTGCYAEVEYDALRAELGREFDTVIVPQSRKASLLEFAKAVAGEAGFAGFSRAEKAAWYERFAARGDNDTARPFSLVPEKFYYHSRAFLKIQDGCDGLCAYCRVPLARGKAQSLDFSAVMDKLSEIIGAGFYEIVLTGVNISAYRSGGHDLASLLEQAVGRSRQVRFRLSSIEPEALTDRLLDVIAHESICPHVHLPVQSGSDRILRLMKRRYHRQTLDKSVTVLKAKKPGLFLAGDFIAGFPGETEVDFAETMNAAGALGFSSLHVFPFSARPGTAAWSLPGRLSATALKERTRALLNLGGALHEQWLSGLRGTVADVILEKREQASVWTGSSAHSVKCRVTGVTSTERRAGARIWARIEEPAKVTSASFLRTFQGKPSFER